MFDSLTQRLGDIFKNLRRRGKLTEDDVNTVLREVRIALLEADVNLKVAKEFIARVREKAVGEQIWKSLTPGQLVVKIVRDQLAELMGSEAVRLNLSSQPPTLIMVVGLHGSGKTTTIAKLALHLRDNGHKPLMVAADIYRPAAITQLQVLGGQIDVPVHALGDKVKPLDICRSAVKRAEGEARDVILIDTAGRLHIDEELMHEVAELKSELHPHEVLLVVDSLTGQDAVNIAERFNQEVGIDGVVLTKLDGDARGGAALSVRHVIGKPIKFVGVGEKLHALEPFHPDRMASRILGMGDVLSLIEKAEQAMDQEKALELEEKIRAEEFTLEDFLGQLQQVRSMGPLDQILGMLPGFAHVKELKNLDVDERQLKRVEAIIQSMTREERDYPSILNASRKRRVARGSGTTVADVNRLLKQYEMLRKMMKQMVAPGGRKGKRGGFPFPFAR